MSYEDPGQFDDPVLKEALRRVYTRRRAAPELRQQVQRRLAELQYAAPADAPGPWRWRRWALAAAVLLAVGTTSFLTYKRYADEREQAEYVAANQPLFEAMVSAHDVTAPRPPATAPADPAALARELQAQLGHSVPTIDLRPLGWTLQSAEVSSLGKTQVAHWRWARGGQSVSVFSVPESAVAGADDVDHYELTFRQHPLAGYLHDEHFNCVIGGPAANLPEVTRLARALRG